MRVGAAEEFILGLIDADYSSYKKGEWSGVVKSIVEDIPWGPYGFSVFYNDV